MVEGFGSRQSSLDLTWWEIENYKMLGVRVSASECRQQPVHSLKGSWEGQSWGQVHKSEVWLRCRSQCGEGRVWVAEGGSREETRSMHSGQLDAIVRFNRGESEITKNKQPQVPQEGCILLAPFPVTLWSPVGHSSCERWKMKGTGSAHPFTGTLMQSSACHLTQAAWVQDHLGFQL